MNIYENMYSKRNALIDSIWCVDIPPKIDMLLQLLATVFVYACVFTRDAKRIVTGPDDKTLKLWSNESAAVLRTALSLDIQLV